MMATNRIAKSATTRPCETRLGDGRSPWAWERGVRFGTPRSSDRDPNGPSARCSSPRSPRSGPLSACVSRHGSKSGWFGKMGLPFTPGGYHVRGRLAGAWRRRIPPDRRRHRPAPTAWQAGKPPSRGGRPELAAPPEPEASLGPGGPPVPPWSPGSPPGRVVPLDVTLVEFGDQGPRVRHGVPAGWCTAQCGSMTSLCRPRSVSHRSCGGAPA